LVHSCGDGIKYHNTLRMIFADRDQRAWCNRVDQDVVFDARHLLHLRQHPRIRYGVIRSSPQRFQQAHEWCERQAGGEQAWSCGIDVAVAVRDATVRMSLWCQPGVPVGAGELRAMSRVSTLTDLRHCCDAVGCVPYLCGDDATAADHVPYRQAIWECKESGDIGRRDACLSRLLAYARWAELRAHGAVGAICFQPGMPLLESELRMDIARLLGLYRGGGSGGRATGRFSVSLETFDDSPLPLWAAASIGKQAVES
jgi:hypothetical protein